jgi:hypothetical protein
LVLDRVHRAANGLHIALDEAVYHMGAVRHSIGHEVIRNKLELAVH